MYCYILFKTLHCTIGAYYDVWVHSLRAHLDLYIAYPWVFMRWLSFNVVLLRSALGQLLHRKVHEVNHSLLLSARANYRPIPKAIKALNIAVSFSGHQCINTTMLWVLLMFSNIYCVNYAMKIDGIHVYDRAMKRLKHGFPTNAHRTFSPSSMNAVRHT